ncbi:YrhC family protein [Bacillus sp. USDA818B3_A]|uniref:YrhC family protein n=1 Tax=Bacillus sp. USDA818B3_A TaxID=2698834 RepID=UPI00136AB832|nr:YrhC family protein [Bacillus sp. USDA818B3_A]
MKQQAKALYEKMVDFKRFGTVLLAVGIFFYLGVITPVGEKTELALNIMVLSSTSFIALSILFFIQFKQYQKKLSEVDEETYN